MSGRRRRVGRIGAPVVATPTRRQPVQREKVEQAHILQLCAVLRARVYVSGTRRSRGRACPQCGTFVAEHQGTRQTPGIPDLEIFLPPPPAVPGFAHRRLQLKWETKATGGRRNADQDEYASWAADAGLHYGCGTYDDFIAWCLRYGYLSAGQVPHYRQPLSAGGEARL